MNHAVLVLESDRNYGSLVHEGTTSESQQAGSIRACAFWENEKGWECTFLLYELCSLAESVNHIFFLFFRACTFNEYTSKHLSNFTKAWYLLDECTSHKGDISIECDRADIWIEAANVGSNVL